MEHRCGCDRPSQTDRWPGGSIGNEAEVYSGYYTEAPSVSQLNFTADPY